MDFHRGSWRPIELYSDSCRPLEAHGDHGYLLIPKDIPGYPIPMEIHLNPIWLIEIKEIDDLPFLISCDFQRIHNELCKGNGIEP